MQNINEWMMHALRKDADELNRMPLQWLELIRNTWTPLVARAISFVVNGGTFLLCTDQKRSWLQHYILGRINNASMQRPLIPIYALEHSLIDFLKKRQEAKDVSNTDFGSVRDILDMSYSNYALWYIGEGNNMLAQFSLENPESFLWLLDESLENSFTLCSDDSNLDFKLMQAYRIFEKALFAGIFSEFNLEAY